MADGQDLQQVEKELRGASDASLGPDSAPSDGVQPTTKGNKKASSVYHPTTTKGWEEYETAHLQRTGPLGHRFKQVIEKLEIEAIKDAEVRLCILSKAIAYTFLGTRTERRY